MIWEAKQKLSFTEKVKLSAQRKAESVTFRNIMLTLLISFVALSINKNRFLTFWQVSFGSVRQSGLHD